MLVAGGLAAIVSVRPPDFVDIAVLAGPGSDDALGGNGKGGDGHESSLYFFYGK
jgi:hypothetical protein